MKEATYSRRVYERGRAKGGKPLGNSSMRATSSAPKPKGKPTRKQFKTKGEFEMASGFWEETADRIERQVERARASHSNKPPYLPNAPLILSKMYEEHKIGRGRALLEELLCNRSMQRAWNIIQKSVQSDRDYQKLWTAIVSAKLTARRGIVSSTGRRKKYNDIAKTAKELSRMIAEPQDEPPSGTALLYTGDLDLQAYELLPEDVASILGAPKWTTMTSEERSAWAYSLLDGWPTMVELLDQLVIRAERLGNVTVSLVERDQGHAREAIFSRYMYHHFREVDPTFSGFAAISAITSIAMGIKDLNSKKVRAMILGPSGKTTH